MLVETLEGYDLFVSGGISSNIEFEAQCCESFDILCAAFDPSINNLPVDHPSIKFYKKAIGSSDSDTSTNLHAILTGCRDALVKLDIEGSEYEWIKSLDENHLNNIKQMVIEFHSPYTDEKLKCIDKILNTHYLVHIHANNVCGKSMVNNINVPNALECTFLRRKDIKYCIPRVLALPDKLDSPNNPCFPQVRLDSYPFIFI